jgi:DNA-binding IclR family transcriptional regulator
VCELHQSLERVIAMIDELASGPKRLGELAETLDIHKSTVLRTLQTLERHGWVRRLGDA